MKMINKDQERKQEINIETYLKKIKRKRENTGKIDIIMSEQKKQKLKYQKRKYQETKMSKHNNE